MADQIKDGGPAFPNSHSPEYPDEIIGGMTLRQWYIGKALQGFCANPAVFAENPRTGWGLVNANEDQLIGYCAHLADLALARSKGGSDE